MKRAFITALLFITAIGTQAQHLTGYLNHYRVQTEYDYNRTASHIGNFVVAADFRLYDNLHLDLGLQANTQNRYAFNAAYQVHLIKTNHSTFYFENRYLYRLFPSYRLQEFNAMFDIGYSNFHWNFQLGLCNRYIAEIPLRINGGEGITFEPMNIVFNIEGNLFDQNHPWNIGCGISNYREFIIERFTLFYYNIHGYCKLNDEWRLTGEAGLHPSGVLNLSSQYNGFFINFGYIYNH